MFGMMEGNRVEISGDLAYDFIAVRDSSIRGEKPDVNAMAAVNDTMVTILLWNYHDLNIITPPVNVNVNLKNLEAKSFTLYHYRVDKENSNSYEKWKNLGSPQNPTAEQYKILEEAGKLEMLKKSKTLKVKNEMVTIPVNLPGQAVSLLVLRWKN